MALQSNHQVTISGADKTHATALAIEFWTGKGFVVHSSSYNSIVFRRNGYGSVGKRVKFLINELVSEKEYVSFDQVPIELTVLCQALPQEAKFNLIFKVSFGFSEPNPGDLTVLSKSLCDEFAHFCRQWMKNGD